RGRAARRRGARRDRARRRTGPRAPRAARGAAAASRGAPLRPRRSRASRTAAPARAARRNRTGRRTREGRNGSLHWLPRAPSPRFIGLRPRLSLLELVTARADRVAAVVTTAVVRPLAALLRGDALLELLDLEALARRRCVGGLLRGRIAAIVVRFHVGSPGIPSRT